MANIHRINDPEQPRGPRFNRVHQYQSMGPNSGRIPFLPSPSQRSMNARDENYWDMLRFLFCPNFSCLSLTIFILLVNTVIYCICVREGIVREGSLLQISEETLLKYGAMTSTGIKAGQVQLLFTSLFLSYDFQQYFINCFFIMVICSNIENAIGSIATAIIYIFGGILGALFGAMAHYGTDQPYVETYAAIYAMMGSFLGFIILNWDAFSQHEDMRCFYLCVAIMITFLIVIITISGGQGEKAVDNIGAIGGLMGGFFLTLAVAPPVIDGGSYEKKCRVFGWTFAGIQLLISFLMVMFVLQ